MKLGALHVGTHEAAGVRNQVGAMGHSQPATPIAPREWSGPPHCDGQRMGGPSPNGEYSPKVFHRASFSLERSVRHANDTMNFKRER